MPANLVFRRKIWGARDNGIPPRSTPANIVIQQINIAHYKNIFLMPITSNYRLIIINGPSDK